MKILIILMTALSSMTVNASVKKLVCSDGPSRIFSAVLDPSTYDPKSGYFRVKNAKLSDIYLASELQCIGATLETIQCIGFISLSGDEVIKLEVSKVGNNYFSSYRALEGNANQTSAPWPCTVTSFTSRKRGPYEAD